MNMRSKTILAAAIALGVLVSGGWGFFSWNESNKALAAHKPWVDVLNTNVFLVVSESSDGKDIGLRALQTGDSIDAGDTVATDETGEGIIHFPDGSSLRLDPNTRVALAEGSYSKDGTVRVRANLFAGRLWSQVIGLVTPESVWEVKTSNAVATVRGTAFGVAVAADGTSAVVGSENTVLVAVVDPKTGDKVEESEKPVTTNEVIEITRVEAETAASVRTNRAAVASIVAIERVEQKGELLGWAKKEAARDEIVQKTLRDLEQEGLSKEEARDILKKNTREKFEEVKKERSEDREPPILREEEAKREPRVKEVYDEVKKIRPEIERVRKEAREKDEPETRDNRDEFEQKINAIFRELDVDTALIEKIKSERATELRQALIDGRIRDFINAEVKSRTSDKSASPASGGGSTSGGVESVVAAKPVSITITSRQSLSETIFTGSTVSLQAILKFSDGTTKNVTMDAEWLVDKTIGFMKSPGIFVASIPAEEAERGEAFGVVAAIYKDKVTGATFSTKTPNLRVEPLVEDDSVFEGQ